MPNDTSRPGQKVAMISSTSLDLPEHRQQAIDACLRQSVFPIAMEQLPARDADAIRVSMEMVEKADIYIGVFAWRYGHIPKGHDISITEMEFNRAVERKIPILIFTIHKDHALTIEMVEADKDAQEKLKRLKERACEGRGRLEFQSPVELRSHIIQSLSKLLAEMDAAEDGEPKTINFHPPNLIPTAPAPYIAHPYTLLQTSEVVGRRDEHKLLTDWVKANKHVPPGIRLFNVVAIGGMGKSALTWKWFNDIAPNELPHLKGRMWWSFYESDAYFENFVIRALAYAAGMTEAAVRELPAHEREDRLFHLLDQQPFLLVLDGLERILLAYARMDAAHLDTLDTRAPSPAGVTNQGMDAEVLPSGCSGPGAEIASGVARVPREDHRLRQCADLRDGRFLRRLAQMRASRVLISTRLFPAELETITAQPLPGCHKIELSGLSDDNALALWSKFIGGQRSGTSEQLLPLFNAFGNYPLLVRALAGRVANYHPAPGDFDRWQSDHPGFNPVAELDLRNAKTHVLHYALEDLGEEQRHVLNTIAAFRMPATWDSLRAVLTGEDKPCRDDRALDDALTELEDRGLVGWDRRANRYDLHPLVRGVLWDGLGEDTRRSVYNSLHAHFEALPKVDNWREVSNLEELTPAIEMYNTLIGLGRYDDAFRVYVTHISNALQYRLSTPRHNADLLVLLFPNGLDQLPLLSRSTDKAYTLNALSLAYQNGGQISQAIPLLRSSYEISEEISQKPNICTELGNLSHALHLFGRLYEAEAAAYRGLIIARDCKFKYREAFNLNYFGLVALLRGKMLLSEVALQRSRRIFTATSLAQAEGSLCSSLSRHALCKGNFDEAAQLAEQAWQLAGASHFERDFVEAGRLQGEAAMGLGEIAQANKHLCDALIRARAANHVEEELPALIALAELRRRQGEPDEAREYLDAVWDGAARGSYLLFHADALNVLTALERDAGNTDKAIAAATEAYKKAWCDGPPFAYHWGLEAARKHLRELGAPEPPMSPFDESKFEPMPDVEINPKDEYYVEVDEEDVASG